MRLLVICSLLIVIGFPNSCRSKSMYQSNDHNESGMQHVPKPGSSFKDSLFILGPSAVFFSPDSNQLLAINKVTDPAVYKSSMHEYYYQMKNARQYLREYWKHVNIIDANKYRYLVFRKIDGNVSIIDLDRHDACGMFTFDRIKEPLLIDMTNVDTQVSDYFSENLPSKPE